MSTAENSSVLDEPRARSTRTERGKTSWRTRRSLQRVETRRIVRERVSELYAEGRTLRDISGLFNLSFGTVRTLLLESGTGPRNRGRQSGTRTT